jgi:GntR family transcriptional regulator
MNVAEGLRIVFPPGRRQSLSGSGGEEVKTSVPLYQHLKAQILQDIQAGKWSPGEQIPSEAELAQDMGVSRITVRQAVGDLVSLGYLSRRQGKGTFLVDRRVSFAASKLHGFAEELRARGYPVAIHVKGICTMTCPKMVASFLNTTQNKKVIQIRRTAVTGNEPIFRETSYLIPPPQADIETLVQQGEEYNHVYGFFDRYGVKISFGNQQISAVKAVYEDTQELAIRIDEPVLQIRRVTSDQTGTPVEFSEVRYAASRYYFEVNLTRD